MGTTGLPSGEREKERARLIVTWEQIEIGEAPRTGYLPRSLIGCSESRSPSVAGAYLEQ